MVHLHPSTSDPGAGESPDRLFDQLIGTLGELSRQLDFSVFFERAARAAADLLGADGAALIVLDDTCYLQYRFFIGLPPQYEARYRNHRFPAHLGTSGQALRSGRPVFCQDYAASEQAMPEYVAAGLKSNLVVPVFAGDMPVGVLAISWFSHGAPDALAHRRVAAVEVLAGLIGSAFHRLRLEQELETRALYDALTGLPNRSKLFARLEHALYQSRQAERLTAVMVMDLDGFKQVNDRLGHQVGDRLLQDVARRLRDVVRRSDMVARLGGDEFVVLVENCASVVEIEHVAARLVTALNFGVGTGGNLALRITASVGITVYPFDDATPEALLSHADAAMYEVKKTGGQRYGYFDARLHRRIHDRQHIELQVRRGLEEGEFRLQFQPVVDAQTGRAVGAEALVRWAHPERGLLAPGEFLPQIEGTAVSARLGAWVLRHTVATLADWERRGLGLWLSVNVDGHELEGQGFASRLREMLREHPDCDPSRLKIEIVESTVINDFDKVGRLIEELAELGVRFVLDDFGTGYASIAYLRRLHIQAIKIDRGFVAAMEDPGERALVGSLIQIASTLFLECVAEGVETAEQRATLLGMGCRLLQGYYLARPMAADDFLVWLAGGPRLRLVPFSDGHG